MPAYFFAYVHLLMKGNSIMLFLRLIINRGYPTALFFVFFKINQG